MRNILLIITVLSFLACKKDVKKEFIKNKKSFEKTSQQDIFNNFEGVWVRKDYVDLLKTSKSPSTSFKNLANISSILIDINKARDNEIEVGLSLNNHEGSTATLVKKETDFYLNLYGASGNSLIKVLLNNSILTFHFEGKKYELIKVIKNYPKGSVDAGYGIQFITNQILFGNEKYNIESYNKNVIFRDDGKVENFIDYTSYEIATDFETDPEPMDWIVLNSSSKDFFHFKFIDNNLLLYEYDKELEDYKIKYTLSKTKK
jgi:hypothetical protein